MDDNLRQNPEAKKSWLKVFAFFVGVVLILIFGILNYFNILSISELYPKYLSFLPRKIVSPNQSNLQLFCPSLREFCQKGEGVVKDGNYIGFGGKLASGSAIFAAFDGVLSSTTSSFLKEKDGKIVQRKFIIAYLDNPDLNLRAEYYFRGLLDKNGKVKKGEQIATSNGNKITTYDNSSLIFSLIPGYPAGNTPAILNKEDFE